MLEYYDKEGNVISHDEYFRLRGRDGRSMEYARVAETTLDDGTWISTVWLGHNHQYGDGPPLIFETMVFNAGGTDESCERYSTLAEAQAGHEQTVRRRRDGGG